MNEFRQAENAPRSLQPTRSTEAVLQRIHTLTKRLAESNNLLCEVEGRLTGAFPEPDHLSGDGAIPSSIFGQIEDALDGLERQVIIADHRASRFQSI